ncbi:MAG: GTPase HflX [Nitrososphaeria archaeon]
MNERSIVVTYREPYSEQEAIELASSAGYRPLVSFKVKSMKEGKYGLSKGKAEELKELTEKLKPELVIIDEQLSASQLYNLSKLLGVKTIDRIRLILDIFEKRAMTTEAKLQVKLAELQYEIPRIKEIVRLTKMGEQTGPMGYGAYEVDKYIRFLNKQINSLRKKLERERMRRSLHRQRRLEEDKFIVALAGYTGAGKTTLFNALTNENKTVTGKMFTTLTTTIRKINGLDNVYLSDTVGFIERLPHYLIESFKSTLEELKYSDLILLVLDYSLDEELFWRKYMTSLNVLEELEVNLDNVVAVLNKIDQKKNEFVFQDSRIKDYVEISALRRINLEKLIDIIKQKYDEGKVQVISTKETF